MAVTYFKACFHIRHDGFVVHAHTLWLPPPHLPYWSAYTFVTLFRAPACRLMRTVQYRSLFANCQYVETRKEKLLESSARFVFVHCTAVEHIHGRWSLRHGCMICVWDHQSQVDPCTVPSWCHMIQNQRMSGPSVHGSGLRCEKRLMCAGQVVCLTNILKRLMSAVSNFRFLFHGVPFVKF